MHTLYVIPPKGSLNNAMWYSCQAVTKISSCLVNTTRWQGNKQLGISFGSIFLLFSYESTQVASGNPWPLCLNDSPELYTAV